MASCCGGGGYDVHCGPRGCGLYVYNHVNRHFDQLENSQQKQSYQPLNQNKTNAEAITSIPYWPNAALLSIGNVNDACPSLPVSKENCLIGAPPGK